MDHIYGSVCTICHFYNSRDSLCLKKKRFTYQVFPFTISTHSLFRWYENEDLLQMATAILQSPRLHFRYLHSRELMYAYAVQPLFNLMYVKNNHSYLGPQGKKSMTKPHKIVPRKGVKKKNPAGILLGTKDNFFPLVNL